MALTAKGLDLLLRRAGLWLRVGTTLRYGLFATAAMAFVLGLVAGDATAAVANLVLLGALVAWMVLSLMGVRSTRLFMQAGQYLHTGQAALAEQALVLAATGFSLQSQTRLLAMHNLASMAHSQGRHKQAARLCHAVLGGVNYKANSLGQRSRILLAESSLACGDLDGAYAQLHDLATLELPLTDQLAVLPARCAYDVLTGSWQSLAGTAEARERLCELLPAEPAAMSLASLALGCHHLGLRAQRDWLWRKATLLANPGRMIQRLGPLQPLAAIPPADMPWRNAVDRTDAFEQDHAGADGDAP